jgi:hypothetical protein
MRRPTYLGLDERPHVYKIAAALEIDCDTLLTSVTSRLPNMSVVIFRATPEPRRGCNA